MTKLAEDVNTNTTDSGKPSYEAPLWANLPPVLANECRWAVGFPAMDSKGKWTKPPMVPWHGGKPPEPSAKHPNPDPHGFFASKSKPGNWLDFEVATSAMNAAGSPWSYAGFLIESETDLYVIDIDNIGAVMKTSDKEIEGVVGQAIADQLYVEYSISGTGLHIIGRGRLPEGTLTREGGHAVGGIEIYGAGRGGNAFMTFSGKKIPRSGSALDNGQATLDLAYKLLVQRAGKAGATPGNAGRSQRRAHEAADPVEVDALVKAMAESEAELWSGAWENTTKDFGVELKYPSQSEADMALVSLIAHACCKAKIPVERAEDTLRQVFTQSGLYRADKERQVGKYAIPKAVDGAYETFTAGTPPGGAVDIAKVAKERASNQSGVDPDEIEVLKAELLAAIDTGDEEQIFAMDTLIKGVKVRAADYPFFIGALASRIRRLKIWRRWQDAVEKLAKMGGGQVAGGHGTMTVAIGALRERSGGWHFAYDSFLERVMVWPKGEVEGRPLQDDDATWFRMHLESTHGEFKASDVREAISAVAMENSFDSAINWITALKWDGTPRIETFYIDVFGVEDSAYTRAVGRYVWTARAGRALVPGIKADMVPILVGAQGARKSSVLQALTPFADAYTSISLQGELKERARQIRGRLVGELEELDGMSHKEVTEIRAFISKQSDDDRPPHGRNYIKYLRRIVFEGTTNETEILRDPAGERRWLPMEVPRGVKADAEAVAEIRDQLWAEAAHVFRETGIEWEAAERLANDKHAKFKALDPDLDLLETALDLNLDDSLGPTFYRKERKKATNTYRIRGYITAAEAAHALGIDDPSDRKKYSARIAAALAKCGCTRDGRRRIDGVMCTIYAVPPEESEG